MEYVFGGLAILIIIFALQFYVKLQIEKKRLSETVAKKKSNDANVSFAHCPLCNSVLKNENLYSRIFRSMTENDQRCIILGCPHCYPKMQAGISRTCPVCKKSVPQDGHLVSRLFNKTKDGKKHVIITGCSVCCKYERT